MWTTLKIALLAAGVTVTALINASTAAACDAPPAAPEAHAAPAVGAECLRSN